MADTAPLIRIDAASDFDGQTVRIRGWLHNLRRSGKILFPTFRDGTGFIQCVVVKAAVAPELFESGRHLTQESSVEVTGELRKEERAPGGFEMEVSGLEILQQVSAEDPFPITPKEHGVDFLMDHRHLWLRSRRQHAILRVRHEVIRAVRDFFDNNGFTLVDTPILTPAACEGTTTLFEVPDFLEYVVQRVVEEKAAELKTLERDTSQLEKVRKPFPRISYDDAVERLKKKDVDFKWGGDFGGTDETLLSEDFDRPVMVHRFPMAIKAFYMQPDEERPELALGVDVLAPEGYGEIIGGGQRIHDYELLVKKLEEHKLPREAFEWYLDLRKYGTVPHGGFGLGIERCVAWICGLEHVRETIAFPRMLYRMHP
jgi:aspartyl/asparaginyl-tRNA synthetase